MRRIAFVLLLVLPCGCAHTQPRWEVSVTVSVETQIDPHTKSSSQIVLKRPIPTPKGT
jgi:hypothetical protein